MQENSGIDHVEIDLTAVLRYSVLCFFLDELKKHSQQILSANITCRDHVSRPLVSEVALCPLLSLSLDFQSCKLPTREIVEGILLQTRPTLTALRLRFGALPCIEAPFDGHPSLSVVEIQAKSSTVQQWERLVTALGTCPNLRAIQLDHYGCLPHNHNLLKQSLEQLVALPRLVSLKLENIPTIGIPIFQAVEQNTTLQTLVVSTYRWGFEPAIQAVARMLQKNSTLKELSISAMDRASLPILQALESNRSLKRLELCRGSGQPPKKAHQGALEMLRVNHSLQNLLISRHEWPHPEVASYLLCNRVKQKLTEITPQTQRQWLDVVVDHRHDLRVVHLLLSMNPTLCITS